MSERLRMLIFSALKSIVISLLLGLSLARVTCEGSRVLLAGDQVFFLGDLPFSPHLTVDSVQNE